MIYLFPFLFIALVLFLLFNKNGVFGKKPKAKKFPQQWHPILLDKVHFYKKLSKKKQTFFQKRMMLFLSGVYIESVQFKLEEIDIILVASSAIIPVFRFKEWHYSNLSTVLIYPDHFNEDLSFSSSDSNRRIAGMVGTGRFKNQMILSRKALHHGFTNATDKGNTAIHEFIHLLDYADGTIDGIPEQLMEHQYIVPWLDLMHKEIEAINNDESDIRAYGGTSQIEFFAVASEYFFERPDLFKLKHPALYEMLSKCFYIEGKVPRKSI